MARVSASEAKSFAELAPITSAGSVRLSIYLKSADIANLDLIRDSLGGDKFKPGPSDVIRHIAGEYLAQKKEIARLRARLAKADKQLGGS